mgnify:CR=1 FL=1
MTIQFHSMKTTNNIPQGYKNSPLGIIPQEWEVKKLGDVAEVLVEEHLKQVITNIMMAIYLYSLWRDTSKKYCIIPF